MKRKIALLVMFILMLLLLIPLAACIPLIRQTGPAGQAPTVEVGLVGTAESPAATATATIEVPATATATAEESAEAPTPTATVTTAATVAPVDNGEPVIITNGATNIRRGPSLDYEVSHVLGAGTIAPVLGRNGAGDWWAVPGPGDGPGPVGWVSAAVVIAQGNLSGVPILPAPPLTPDLPIMGNSGSLPGGDTCVVAHPGPNDLGPLYLRQGPGNAFDAVAILGLNRWADIVKAQNDWYRIRDSAGTAGWVHESNVAFAGRCSGPGSGPDVPLVEDPGAPPSNTCVALRKGQFPPPDIHLGPGRQFALVARLGNWAEVLKTEAGWHQILLGPGDVGWISNEDVDLSGPCATPEPAPERIHFAPGETSITLEGMLEPPQRDAYLFRALAGQRATIEIVSEENRTNFAVSGMGDGQPYKRLEDELRSWSTELPATQDYLLTVAAPADAATTGYRLLLTIEPLETPQTGLARFVR